MGQLNSQVDFLNSRCAQLEQALAHEQAASRQARLNTDERRQYMEAIRALQLEKHQLANELERASQLASALGVSALGVARPQGTAPFVA